METTNKRTALKGSRTQARRGSAIPGVKTAFVRPVEKDSDWRDRSACATSDDPDLWFSDKSRDQAVARAVCQECPVLSECLGSAMDLQEKFGIWGGLDFGAPVKPWAPTTVRNPRGSKLADDVIARISRGELPESVVEDMGYTSVRVLEDLLRRAGRKDAIKALRPEYRTRDEIRDSSVKHVTRAESRRARELKKVTA